MAGLIFSAPQSAPAWRPGVKRNFSPNRRLLGYNVDSPILYRAIRVIFWLCVA
jgi:hypothetical protein